MLSCSAHEYVTTNNLRSKMICSNCRRFERTMHLTDPKQITAESLAAFRVKLSGALSPVTIEKTITDVITVVHHATGQKLDPGKRIKKPRPEPEPVPISTIDAIYPRCPAWLQQWLVLCYWTALRLQDSIALQISLNGPANPLRWRAGKTGIHHAYPVPRWLEKHLAKQELPYDRSTVHFGRTIRRHISAACLAAGVPDFSPQQLRQRSVTEWSRANATAGSLIHGCGIGVLAHYIDPLSVLESAAPRVRLPACFGADASQDAESGLLDNFRRLDPAAKNLITGTAERLAAG